MKTLYILVILVFMLFFSSVAGDSIVQTMAPESISSDLLKENEFLLSSYGENATIYLYRSLIYYNERQFEAALEAARYSQQFEDTQQAWQLIGMSSAHLGNYQAAADAFARVVWVRPEDPVARNMHAVSLTQIGEGRAAIEEFNNAISLDSKYAAAYNNRGVAQYILKDYVSAESSLKKAVQLDPESSIYYGNLAWVYFARGDLKRADRAVRDARVLDYTDPFPYFISGNVAFHKEQYQLAYYSYQSGFGQLAETNQWYYVGVSKFSEVLNRRGADVVDSYYKSVSSDVQYRGTWDRTTVVEYKIKRYEQSLSAEYDKILLIEPDYATIWMQFGYSAIQLGKYPEALNAYNEALKLDPQNIEARIGYAHVVGKGGDYIQAMEILDDILGVHPDNAWGYYSRGEVQLAYGKYDEAKSDLTKAIQTGYSKPAVYSSFEKIAAVTENQLLQTYYALRCLLAI